MQNVEDTIISQYANSPIILALIDSYNASLDQTQNINNFYDNVWNIETANHYGLLQWGQIIGVTNVVPLPAPITGHFGFSQQAESQSFGHGSFYSIPPATQNYTLTDDAYRTLLLIKALANISNCSIPTYNKILMELFPGRGNAYVSDLGNMQMDLVFEFLLQPYEVSILKYSGAFSNPTGVQSGIRQYNRGHVFGFSQQSGSNGFGNGTFFKGYL